MKTWQKVAIGTGVGVVAGVTLVNLAAIPTFGIVGKLYDMAKKAYGDNWRKQVESQAAFNGIK